jgi:hypothetical protein
VFFPKALLFLPILLRSIPKRRLTGKKLTTI